MFVSDSSFLLPQGHQLHNNCRGTILSTVWSCAVHSLHNHRWQSGLLFTFLFDWGTFQSSSLCELFSFYKCILGNLISSLWLKAHSYPNDSELHPLPVYSSWAYQISAPFPATPECPGKLNKFFKNSSKFPLLFCHLFPLSALPTQLTNQDIYHPFLLHKCKTDWYFLYQTCTYFSYMH